MVFSITACFAVIAPTLLTLEAKAFEFPALHNSVQVVHVPEHYAGEIWAVARTESWERTKNTVWSQCSAVLGSYGMFTDLDVMECERHVAVVNHVSKGSLNDLNVGEPIILPLLQSDALAYGARVQPQQVPSVPQEIVDALARLNTQVITQGERLQGSLAKLEDQNSYQSEQVKKIANTVESIDAKVPAEPLAPALAPLPTVLTENMEDTNSARAPPTAFTQLQALLLEHWWILAIAALLILILLLSIVALVASVIKSRRELALERSMTQVGRTEESRMKTQERRNEDSSIELQGLSFEKQPYWMDGEAHWVQLEKIDATGRYYKTPFAQSVREENLLSHFSQVLRKNKMQKAA